jgi:hypothetical protein
MSASRALFIPLILLNVIAASFAYPLAQAFYRSDKVEQATGASPLTSTYKNEYFEMLKFAYATTRDRKESFAMPPPGFYIGKMNMGTDKIPIEAYTVTLILPCYSGMSASTFKVLVKTISEGISALTMKILNVNKKSETSSSSSSIEEELPNLINEFYNEYLKAQARALGIKPAFLPYEKMSFIFIILIWIRPQSIMETFAKPAIDSLQTSILFIYYLQKSTALDLSKEVFLYNIKKSISEKIDTVPTISTEIVSTMQKYAQSLTCSDLCDTICKKIDNKTECHQECNREIHVKIEMTTNSIKSYFYMNGKMLGSYTYNLDLTDKILKTGLISSIILQNFPTSSVDLALTQLLAYKLESNIFENFNNLAKNFYKTADFAIELNTNSCDVAKSILSLWINNLQSSTKQFLISSFNELNTTLATATNTAYNNAKESLNNIIRNIKGILGITAEIATELLEDQVVATVFPAYIVFNALFKAFQYTILSFKVDIKGAKDLMGGNENILLFDKFNKKAVVTYLSNEGEMFTINICPSPEDAIAGALKGSITVLIDTAKDLIKETLGKIEVLKELAFILYASGTLISEGLKVIPNIYIISADLEDSSGRQLLSPARAGIYCLNLTINPETPATYATNLASIVINIIGSIKDKATEMLGNIFGETVAKYIGDKYKEFTSDIQIKEPKVYAFVPFLVLPPYFITEQVTVTKDHVSITMRAIYDFAALLRRGVSSQTELLLNKEYQEALNKANDVLKNVINDFFRNVAEDLTKYAIGVPIINTIIGKFVGEFVASITDPLSNAISQSIIGISSVVFPEFNYKVALTLLDRFLAQSAVHEYVPIIRYEKRNIVPLFSAINAIGSPIDSDGKSTVVIPTESIASIGLGSLEAVPLYIDDEGHSFIVPDSITSFEPIVAPLIPVAMYMDGRLIIRFATPFVDNIKLSYFRFRVSANIVFDNKIVKGLNWDENLGLWIDIDNLKDWSIIRLQVNEVSAENGCLLGVALLIPYTVEMPVYVNPMRAVRSG